MDEYLAKLRYRLSEQGFKWFSISPGVVDERYGSFTPAWRFTRDQIPLPFDLCGGKAWYHDSKTSQCISAGPGLDKRQATLDLMLSGDLSEEQPPPATAPLFSCVSLCCAYCNLRKLHVNLESQFLMRLSFSVGPASASVALREQPMMRTWWCSSSAKGGKTEKRRWIGRSEL